MLRAAMSSTSRLLNGIKVVELAGLAPVPHCGLVLSDFGASVTLLERDGDAFVEQRLVRGKEREKINLKSAEGLARARELCLKSDVLLDPFRPGVLEKIGLDPVKLLEENEKLVVCRLTGFGQHGPMSKEAGHDINYVAITGLLPTVAGRTPYWPPANLLADFAGGGLTAAFGIVSALVGRQSNGGKGCIIDCSMVEGLAYLGSFISQYQDQPHLWTEKFCAFGGENPIYRCYETKDGKFMSVGALEPQFTAKVFEVLELDMSPSDVYADPAATIKLFEETFRKKTRDEWTNIFAGHDACVAPVLDISEAGDFHHNAARGTFTKDGERWIPQPAPKVYSREEYKQLMSKL